jgi:hypothetical protein
MIDDGVYSGIEYTGLWLRSEHFEVAPETLDEQPAGIVSYALFYPDKAHPVGGYIVSLASPESDYLNMIQGVELDPAGVAEDLAKNGDIRRRIVDRTKESGGLLADISDKCERLRVPLGAIVLWLKDERDETPSFASFHSVADLPPEQALRALKFAIWERTSR